MFWNEFIFWDKPNLKLGCHLTVDLILIEPRFYRSLIRNQAHVTHSTKRESHSSTTSSKSPKSNNRLGRSLKMTSDLFNLALNKFLSSQSS